MTHRGDSGTSLGEGGQCQERGFWRQTDPGDLVEPGWMTWSAGVSSTPGTTAPLRWARSRDRTQ